jgi:DNA-binding NarL/FixJ family response regulator
MPSSDAPARRPLEPRSAIATREPTLTPREADVVRLIARGLTNRQIAGELVSSERTASSHVYRLLGKLGFSSRAQVAAWATRRGLGEPEA